MSIYREHNTHYVHEDWLLATVAAHLRYEEGLTIDGGVTARTLAASMDRDRHTLAEHLRRLCDQGKLHRYKTQVIGRSGTPYSYHLDEARPVVEMAGDTND